MKRYYRNRIILGAMLSFFLLLVLAISGIWLFSYQQMESETDSFLSRMHRTGAEEQPAGQPAPPRMFGYTPRQLRYLSAFYDIALNADGTICSVQRYGIVEEAETDVEKYVQEAVNKQASAGKTGSYKYSMVYNDDGTARLILLDISIQLQALYNMLKSALLVGAALMVLLFLILLPVSSRMAGVFIRNNEKQKQFITDAGHDLKTPVAIIRSNLDVLELQGKNKWSENIRSQTVRLEKLIEQLLMMARLDETSGKIQRVPLDLAAIIREEKQHFQLLTDQRDITWHDSLPDRFMIGGDEKSIRQMMNLLLDNAAQYTNPGGEITLKCAGEKKKAVLQIFNTVEKLPEQAPETLLERFVRGSSARTQQNAGAGIGLSAVKRITEMHRDKVSITYPDEHTFCVTVAFAK